ncbi:hypothetical protein Strain138_000477 [Pseudogemmatithrix spongiicola]|uniref:Uncharacterized protein n=1 Tax=Pseudogemmatithrix spongiicola TaxID=3062599 RepID=A0AA49JY75_9BACT|nr:hypothetical protein Strain138_000477 [Gemmatimonadaceae bacterium 'strain 138']WKW14151.1 hypothetical protein Strain318_000477 [Gemmatimonadaceae bacterium 'strain 318']
MILHSRSVGFDYSVVQPTLDVSPITSALVVQTDRTIAVANAPLAVQQGGFLAVQKAVQNGLMSVGIQLAAIGWAIRNGTVTGVEPVDVPFDSGRTK